MAAAIEVVELRLRDGVVHVESRHEEAPLFLQFIEAMHSGGGLLRDSAPRFDHSVPVRRIFAVHIDKQIFDDLFFCVGGGAVYPFIAVFQLVSFVDKQGDVTAVVHDHFGALTVWEVDRLTRAPPVFFERLTLPREDGNARSSDSSGGVVLGGENVAACPTHQSAKIHQRLN